VTTGRAGGEAEACFRRRDLRTRSRPRAEEDAAAWPAAEHGSEPLAPGCGAALDELAVGGDDAELALALV
jgi:hypothetical protein